MEENEWKELKEKEKLLKEAARSLKVDETELPNVVKRFNRELEEMEESIRRLKKILQL